MCKNYILLEIIWKLYEGKKHIRILQNVFMSNYEISSAISNVNHLIHSVQLQNEKETKDTDFSTILNVNHYRPVALGIQSLGP